MTLYNRKSQCLYIDDFDLLKPDLCHLRESESNNSHFKYLPARLDFLIHVAIVPAALVETVVGDHRISLRESMRSMSLFIVCYSAWSMCTYYMTNKWPYGWVLIKTEFWINFLFKASFRKLAFLTRLPFSSQSCTWLPCSAHSYVPVSSGLYHLIRKGLIDAQFLQLYIGLVCLFSCWAR